MKIRDVFIWLCRIALAVVFIGACIAKIRDPAAFALAVYRYRMLPYPLVNGVGIYLPWVELLTGIGVLLPWKSWRAAASFLIFGMLLVFSIAISANLIRGINVACGCFSMDPSAAISDGWNLLRNLILLGCAVAVVVGSLNEQKM